MILALGGTLGRDSRKNSIQAILERFSAAGAFGPGGEGGNVRRRFLHGTAVCPACRRFRNGTAGNLSIWPREKSPPVFTTLEPQFRPETGGNRGRLTTFSVLCSQSRRTKKISHAVTFFFGDCYKCRGPRGLYRLRFSPADLTAARG